TPPTLADGDIERLQLDDLANLKVSLGDPAQLNMIKTGNLSPNGNTLISTYNDKFRDDFNTFDEVNNWEVMQLGDGQSYTLRGVANGARFLAINSGTTSGAETISIYAVTGVCVAQKVMQQEHAQFHLPAKGMYIISIEHNGQNERIKVIR
ncbi:MAG: T9SS type A sorting domain-containing protein, partial [Bacteroidia bacterium]|nr:T9SS type A sorting domain-containing protein [Bacteroidia bacterium]